MFKKHLSIICVFISIILMASPNAIAMTFAPGPTERITRYFSYFNLTPLGYGNGFPLITLLFSFAALILLLIALRKPSMRKGAQVCLIICIISSLLSWFVFDTFTIIGALVGILHLASFFLQKLYQE